MVSNEVKYVSSKTARITTFMEVYCDQSAKNRIQTHFISSHVCKTGRKRHQIRRNPQNYSNVAFVYVQTRATNSMKTTNIKALSLQSIPSMTSFAWQPTNQIVAECWWKYFNFFLLLRLVARFAFKSHTFKRQSMWNPIMIAIVQNASNVWAKCTMTFCVKSNSLNSPDVWIVFLKMDLIIIESALRELRRFFSILSHE